MRRENKSFILYVGIKGAGDIFTNEVICSELTRRGLSTEYEGKDYKGGRVHVWQVDSEFVNSLYNSKNYIRLEFLVFARINHVFQLFRLLEPAVKHRAKQMRLEILKEIKEKGGQGI